MKNEELKPCPFCGGKPDLVGVINSDLTRVMFTRVMCMCGASFTHERKASRYTLEETVGAWNFRPDEERLQKRIDALESIARDYVEAHALSACGEATAFVARIVHYFEQYGDKK